MVPILFLCTPQWLHAAVAFWLPTEEISRPTHIPSQMSPQNLRCQMCFSLSGLWRDGLWSVFWGNQLPFGLRLFQTTIETCGLRTSIVTLLMDGIVHVSFPHVFLVHYSLICCILHCSYFLQTSICHPRVTECLLNPNCSVLPFMNFELWACNSVQYVFF
jgi:hypothetical protein